MSKPTPRCIAAIDIASRYRHIKPVPQKPNFSAKIDLDLTQPIGEETARELYQALLDFEVLLFPPQEISPEQHIALGRVFGDITPGSFIPRKPKYPQIEVIEFDEQRPPEVNIWHSDITWQASPPSGTVIQITELPEHGGNTSWASLSAAYAALSPGLQAYLAGLTATHSWEVSGFRDALAMFGDEAVVAAFRNFKPVRHPVVRPHPESGKPVLFVNETFTKRIDDVHFRESRGILQFLREWIVQPEFVYDHRWEKNGLAVWDNRTTQHYASADYWPHRRVTQRVTFNARGGGAVSASPLEKVAAAVATSGAAV